MAGNSGKLHSFLKLPEWLADNLLARGSSLLSRCYCLYNLREGLRESCISGASWGLVSFMYFLNLVSFISWVLKRPIQIRIFEFGGNSSTTLFSPPSPHWRLMRTRLREMTQVSYLMSAPQWRWITLPPALQRTSFQASNFEGFK